jgi:hypothetical protein
LFVFSAIGLMNAPAATLYVSTQGSDANPGTSAQPFRTIVQAYGLAKAGDSILVMPGVYTDYTSGWGLHLGSSGTASSPIALRSQVRGGAVLDGQNVPDRNVGIYIDGSYNIVDGFEIRNGTKGGITIWANGNQILNCNIHNNGNLANSSTEGRDGIYSSEGTADNVYTANYIHHNGRSGSNLDHGLYLCGQNEMVANNVLFANSACGLQVAGYTTVSNLKVYNNVMAFNGTDGIILWQSLNGVDVKNNIFYQNGHYGIGSYDAHGSGVTVDNNLSFGNGSGDFSFSDGGSDYLYQQGATVYLDPHFVNGTATGFDAHLATGSPAIQAAVNLSSVFSTDMDGITRSIFGAWDLGAYISSAAAPPSVSISAPLNGATVSGTIAVSANASSIAGIARVQFQCDGSNIGNPVSTAPYTLTINTGTMADGWHSLNAIAWDAAGNQTTAGPISIQVANISTPPVLGLPRKLPEGVSLTWTSVPGKIYRVASRPKMGAPWTDLSGSITATQSSTSWIDATTGGVQQRFYTVYSLN